MSDFTYKIVRFIGSHPFWVSSRPVILHRDRVPMTGRAILAPSHLSHFDVPCLIYILKRNIDFLSVAEFKSNPPVYLLFRGTNCLFLDRSRSDVKTARECVHRLEQERLLAMFPEGRIRDWEDSVIHGKPFKPGVARIARLAEAPIIPSVLLGTEVYRKVSSWLPLKRIRFGVNFGHPIHRNKELDDEASEKDLMTRLSAAYLDLYEELRRAMPWFEPPK